MQNFLKKRVLPLVLAISVVLSLVVVPAKAASSAVGGQIAAGKTTLTEALGDYPSFFEGVIAFVERTEFGSGTSAYSPGVSLVSRISEPSFIFDVGSVENLHSFATAINMNDVGLKCLVTQTGTGPNDYYYIQYISIQKWGGAQMNDRTFTGALKLKYTAADENGLILVASVAAAGDVEGQWLPYNKNLLQDTTSYENLDAIKLNLQAHGVQCQLTRMDIGYVITRSTGVPPYYVTEAYCNAWGGIYVAPADDRVLTDNRTHIDGDGNKVNVGLDLDGGTLSLGDGAALDITQLIYDEAAKTYYIDTLDQSTNITQTFTWMYFIDYTSITYIGATEEYNKYYEFYYELPDGRSSADLTPEELEQLNVSMDILPYIRSADDVSIRALYHFDGDTRDSSYWSYAGDFTWNSGASITYMDSGVFEGALYLNENAHKFTVTLPSNITMADFTLQFRYYQSHTAAPQTDSSISIGGVTLMQFDGQSIKNGSGTVLTAVDVGNWQEICIMRSGGTVTYFHNGVKIGSVSNSTAMTDKLVFTFGANQQTYKYFDELRFTQKALYPTSGYEVSSVPFDTNLALVLPDSQIPVADAYWNISSSKTNLLASSGMDNWYEGNVDHLSNIYNWPHTYTLTEFTSSTYWFLSKSMANDLYNNSHYPTWSKWNDLSELNVYQDHGVISTPEAWVADNGTDKLNHLQARFSGTFTTTSGLHYWLPTGGIMTLLGYKEYNGTDNYYLSKGTYTFSMVDTEGNVGSVSFTIPTLANKTSYAAPSTSKTITFNGYRIGMVVTYPNYNTNQYGTAVWLVVQPTTVGAVNPFMYLELVSGSSTDLTAEYVESVTVMDKDDFNTLSLAIKTDLDITGHQIGGMRPSLPYKGLVWGLVEGGIIKSLQIYNGSAWEAVDGRIWTGSRWVPYSAYNVLLLKDLYDISGTVSPDDYEYIYTEEGFWSWWQKQWLDFVAWLKGAVGNGTGGENGEGGEADTDTDIPPVTDDDGGEWKFLDLLIVLKDGLWNVGKGITTTVFDGISGLVVSVDGIGGFFNEFSSGGGVFGIYEEGASVWD